MSVRLGAASSTAQRLTSPSSSGSGGGGGAGAGAFLPLAHSCSERTAGSGFSASVCSLLAELPSRADAVAALLRRDA